MQSIYLNAFRRLGAIRNLPVNGFPLMAKAAELRRGGVTTYKEV